MANTFFILYKNYGTYIVYCAVQDIDDFNQQLRRDHIEKLYIYYYYKEEIRTNSTSTWLVRTYYDMADFFNTLSRRHTHYVDSARAIQVYSVLHRNWPIAQREYVLAGIQRIQDELMVQSQYTEAPDSIERGISVLRDWLANVPVDVSAFVQSYAFDRCTSLWVSDNEEGMNDRRFNPMTFSSDLVLRDVYYMNKQWYDGKRNAIDVEEFQKDFEYKVFHSTSECIQDMSCQFITENVLFLDYIYSFYNFGEFWDIVKRLIVSKPMPVFYLPTNRITDIAYYFNTLGFSMKYPYKKNTLYHFDTIHVRVLSGCWRGFLNKFDAHLFNCRLNPGPAVEISYRLYLSRGSYRRGIRDEEELIGRLQENGFLILNGSESREQLFHCFTNASIILGAHSSLMKNMVWCKKSPMFVEFCPYTRHACFMGNALALGFKTFFFVSDCDTEERIVFTDAQKTAFYEFLELVIPK